MTSVRLRRYALVTIGSPLAALLACSSSSGSGGVATAGNGSGSGTTPSTSGSGSSAHDSSGSGSGGAHGSGTGSAGGPGTGNGTGTGTGTGSGSGGGTGVGSGSGTGSGSGSAGTGTGTGADAGTDAGSGSGSSGPSDVSCDTSSVDALCIDYRSVPASEMMAYSNGCTGTVGSVCPSGNVAGCCTFTNPGTVDTTDCYYAPTYTAAEIMQVCTNGTFSTTPEAPAVQGRAPPQRGP